MIDDYRANHLTVDYVVINKELYSRLCTEMKVDDINILNHAHVRISSVCDGDMFYLLTKDKYNEISAFFKIEEV